MSFINKIKKIFSKAQTVSIPKRKSYAEIIPTLKINENKIVEVSLEKQKFKINKAIYEEVERATGVPADVIYAIHYRECSNNFGGCLANGEMIIGKNRKTTLVPAGRGPFKTWAESAIDALHDEKSKFPNGWSFENKLAFCEAYNGMGYKNKGIPSPYVLAGTNEYKSGMYVADGRFSSSAIDKRLGCASIILGLKGE